MDFIFPLNWSWYIPLKSNSFFKKAWKLTSKLTPCLCWKDGRILMTEGLSVVQQSKCTVYGHVLLKYCNKVLSRGNKTWMSLAALCCKGPTNDYKKWPEVTPHADARSNSYAILQNCRITSLSSMPSEEIAISGTAEHKMPHVICPWLQV